MWISTHSTTIAENSGSWILHIWEVTEIENHWSVVGNSFSVFQSRSFLSCVLTGQLAKQMFYHLALTFFFWNINVLPRSNVLSSKNERKWVWNLPCCSKLFSPLSNIATFQYLKFILYQHSWDLHSWRYRVCLCFHL